MTALDTTALLEKLDKPVRYLKWRAYGNQHLSGWQGQGSMGGLWYITDTGPDGEGKDGWWCDGERFDTADEAQAAAQADYERRILSALSLTPSDLEAIKAALVEREWLPVPEEPTLEFLKSINIDNPVLAYENGRYYNAWFTFEPSEGGWFWTDEADSEPNPSHYMPLPAPPRAALGKEPS